MPDEALNTTSSFLFSMQHQGHEKEALQLMATYLPKDTSPGSAYQEGGGLYALGLIHANHGGDIIDYLLSQLKNASNDVRFWTFALRDGLPPDAHLNVPHECLEL